MTSTARELGGDGPSMREVEDVVVRAFGDVFELTPRRLQRPQIAASEPIVTPW